MARTQAVYYRDKHGVEPVNEFIEALSRRQAAKIDDYVEEYLNDRPASAPPPEFPVSSQIDGELRELRVRFANTRYRVLYQRSDNLVVLLHAIEKNTGAIADSDIRLAKQRMADFKRRMDASRGCRQGPRAKLRRLAAGEEVEPFIKIDKLVSR
jgi:phage-related protein